MPARLGTQSRKAVRGSRPRRDGPANGMTGTHDRGGVGKGEGGEGRRGIGRCQSETEDQPVCQPRSCLPALSFRLPSASAASASIGNNRRPAGNRGRGLLQPLQGSNARPGGGRDRLSMGWTADPRDCRPCFAAFLEKQR